MNELTITVAGWVATDVRLFQGQGDLAIASFRLASTPRFYDRERSVWVDGVTEWFTVRAFRGAAITVKRSIEKGMPVVVTGRMRTSTWEAKDGTRVDHVIDASALGPDCMRGVATFTRATGDASLTAEDMSAAAGAIAASHTGADEEPPADDLEPAFDAAEDPVGDDEAMAPLA
ncbi:single-stranded DNA-binding protein [Demequina mangrovi]|uniref:Single-strand DNA-binding protein n=1 Tax=Demequina mangrovi TaxID=1043493 RepID=A0A1H7ATG7_9MICO|nr:single-stranded DNA-binding protein [Demequina mangrovi]SEJ68246.1 single-strand DNA-binding protein [Demequina mangrovi]